MERVGSNILKGEICMGIETQMHVVIQEELEKLKVMEIGTEEYKTTVDGVTKLVDRAIEMERLNNEITAGAVTRGDDRIDKIVKNCISVAGIVIPTIVTIWGTLKSFKFEQEGTITTIMGRGFINKLLPKK